MQVMQQVIFIAFSLRKPWCNENSLRLYHCNLIRFVRKDQQKTFNGNILEKLLLSKKIIITFNEQKESNVSMLSVGLNYRGRL